jgi:hypothetical protein
MPPLSAAAAEAAKKLKEARDRAEANANRAPAKRPRRQAPRRARGGDAPAPWGDADSSGSEVDGFYRAALGWLLWRRPEEGELPEIPTSFADAREYVRAFEPALVEETREQVRKEWLESVAEKRQYRVRSMSHWSPYDPVRVVNADP